MILLTYHAPPSQFLNIVKAQIYKKKNSCIRISKTLIKMKSNSLFTLCRVIFKEHFGISIEVALFYITFSIDI